MKKLPITLCVITYNSDGRLKDVIQKCKPFVKEIIVVDQYSTDGTYETAKKLADTCIRRRRKGTADPDRNWLFGLANYEWVLYLDDDEYLSKKLINVLPALLKDNIDIYWLKTKNLVDGMDIGEIFGKDEDPHPRLFRKNSIRFPDKIHTYPEPANNVKIAYLNHYMVHERSFKKLKDSNRSRNQIASPENIKLQENFITQVEKILKRNQSED